MAGEINHGNTLHITVCSHCRKNAARYIDQDGELTCATCPIQYHLDSIRIADVPALLAIARAIVADVQDHPPIQDPRGWTETIERYAQKIRETIGKAPGG